MEGNNESGLHAISWREFEKQPRKIYTLSLGRDLNLELPRCDAELLRIRTRRSVGPSSESSAVNNSACGRPQTHANSTDLLAINTRVFLSTFLYIILTYEMNIYCTKFHKPCFNRIP
jgi:hypothetical protein